MNKNIHYKIESFLGENISNSQSVSGGCIADSRVITTSSANQYFLKTKAQFEDMFTKEANGLKELAKANCIRIPNVILCDTEFLLIEYIKSGTQKADFFEDFGRVFAQLHRYTAQKFGFYEDNYIGASIQYNTQNKSDNYNWSEFYYLKRILPQFKMLENKGMSNVTLRKSLGMLERRIDSLFKGSEELPCLMHGDLWCGNFMCDEEGNPVIFDPATYYGHRELDVAMTKMFGGFSYEFYEAYQSTFPLPAGWQEREKMYLLYHYLNHLNLFGSSYYGNVVDIINYYQ